MPRVTGLRELRGGRVAVALDGTAWRTLPADAVVRAGLLVGCELDRPRARTLARELRRGRTLAHAARALRHRALTTRELDDRLERAGFREPDRAGARETLAGAGLVDDARFALARAESLAARGQGDAAIRWDLERRGVAGEQLEGALAALEPEGARARRIVAERGAGPATARLLARRGFSEDVVASAAGSGIGYEH